MATPEPADLAKRFEAFIATGEPVALTGLQALARLLLEQVRLDRAAGLRVGGYVSGYPGSPLAGFDGVLDRLAPLLAEHGIRFQLGLNEEMAAAAVAGSQLVDLFPHAQWDGVVGLWYGKAPGLDRCLDVFRHASFTGISQHGGAVAVAGDDPACKSSSLPSQSELAFAHAMMPVLVPSGPADVIDVGLHAFALSRYAGLVTGLKVVADVCDGGELVRLPDERPAFVLPSFEVEGRPFAKRLDPRLLPPMVRELERELIFERLEAARRFVYANGLDRIDGAGPGARVGFVAAGIHQVALEAAFEQLGLDASERERLGVRVLRLALVWPLEERRLREFARGLESIVVLDDRRGFLEQQVRDALYGAEGRPVVVGQRDESGAPWLASEGALHAEGLALDLAPFLGARLGNVAGRIAGAAERLEGLRSRRGTQALARRRPHFCSGCPHLHSTRVPEGHAAAGGIGCHTMVLLAGGEMRYVGAMGSEGAHWNGLAPFVDTPHLFQNLGDGTYFHSGRQAIRACVDAGTSITFKLLYNGSIAMTGGQQAAGAKAVPAVIADLLADGVRRVIAVSEDPAVAAVARREPAVECVGRGALEDAQRRLAAEPGVSVLVYDSECANAAQRAQRRGDRPGPSRRILIHRDVCEGCGDCGRASECLSVRPVATSLGRKTEIHQGSCSQDEACLVGDCPAFISVDPRDGWLEPLHRPDAGAAPTEDPALPPIPADGAFSIFLAGIGSTGVVSLDAVLVAAARRAGLHAVHLDQTGLSQRGGRVTSHLRLAARPRSLDPHVPWGGADLLLAFDPLAAADPESLPHFSSDRTQTVMSDHLAPTAEMVRRPDPRAPEVAPLASTLRAISQSFDALPAEPLCEALLGTPLPANLMLLGFAFERGRLPLASRHVERGIADCLGGGENLEAFRLGRVFARAPERIAQILDAALPPAIGDVAAAPAAGEDALTQAGVRFPDRWPALQPLIDGVPDDGTMARRIASWAIDLADYQNAAYGDRYLCALVSLATAERATASPSRLVVVPVAARELYRLMAYKDEYEVARLLVRGPWSRWLARRSEGRARPSAWLHPPFLRALGLRRKLRFGPALAPLLRGLAAMRGLRGTALDPFGRSAIRRLERALPGWYERLLADLASRLDDLDPETAARLAAIPESIRGFENLKIERAERAIDEARRLLAALDDKDDPQVE